MAHTPFCIGLKIYPKIFEIPLIIPSPFDACLREAASAKAGGRVRYGWGWTLRQAQGRPVVSLSNHPPPLHPLPPGEGKYLGAVSKMLETKQPLAFGFPLHPHIPR
ncbi:MAG: hypothetical protein A2V86_06710 [Deltaproteobacteria bacterium RBG_16_49_23]|nr:MAG: hypothetical protein A2V86_06710 [Deltaproteobacteria bacterium RBG_16_49_23]